MSFNQRQPQVDLPFAYFTIAVVRKVIDYLASLFVVDSHFASRCSPRKAIFTVIMYKRVLAHVTTAYQTPTFYPS